MRLTVRAKLVIIVGVSALAFLLIMATSAVTADRVEARLATIQDRYLPKIELEPRLAAAFEKLRRGFQDAVAAHDADALAATRHIKSDFLEEVAAAPQAVEPGAAAALREALERYDAAAYEVSRRLIADETGEGLVDAMSAMQKEHGRFAETLKRLTAFDGQRLVESFASAREAVAEGTSHRLWISLASLAAVVLLSAWLGRGVLRSLGAFTSGFQRFATGDFGEPIQASPDELGDAAHQANLMAAALDRPGREHRKSAERFQRLLESAPDAMIIHDDAGAIVLVNARAETLFGYSRAELLGMAVEALVPERFHGERARRKDGSEFATEITLSPLETEDGILVSAAIRDITERKRADAQRFHLAAIVDSTDDAIISETLAGVTTSWNHGASRLFGHAVDEVVGRPFTLLLPRIRVDEEAEILVRLAQGDSVPTFDAVVLRKDGREVDVSVTMSSIRDSAGNVIGVSKVVRDITDRKRAEEALAQAKESAEAASRELEAFSYSVAHDLRAPLRGMNGFAQILLEDYKDKLDAEGQDSLLEIRSNAQRMGALIDSLLSLARVTKSSIRPEHVDLSAIAHSTVSRLAAQDAQRNVDVVVQEDLSTEADPGLVQALLENLLGNAFKFTSRTQAPQIQFGAMEVRGSSVLFVRDNGAGFDMANAAKLFAPFQRLHAAVDFPGTGIGLATVQRIVRRHGGHIWAEGRVGAGATFYFTLPPRAAARGAQ